MIMKLTLFKLGLVVTVMGILWTRFEFSNGEKISKNFNLFEKQTDTLDILNYRKFRHRILQDYNSRV